METVREWVGALGPVVATAAAAYVALLSYRHDASKADLEWLRPSFYHIGYADKEESEGSKLVIAVQLATHNPGGQPAIVSNVVLRVRSQKDPGQWFPLVHSWNLEPAVGRRHARITPPQPILINPHSVSTAWWVFGLGNVNDPSIPSPPDSWAPEAFYAVDGREPSSGNTVFRFTMHVDKDQQYGQRVSGMALSPTKRAQELVKEQTRVFRRG